MKKELSTFLVTLGFVWTFFGTLTYVDLNSAEAEVYTEPASNVLVIEQKQDFQTSFDYCSEQIAKNYIKSGVDTRQELIDINVTGKVYDTILANIIVLENEAKAKALAAERARRDAVVTHTTSASSVPETTGKSSATKIYWTRSQVSGALASACDYYQITEPDRTWIIQAGLSVAYKESTFQVNVHNSTNHVGLLQFSGSWGSGKCKHDVADWRECGHCSCYRFVKVLKDGGRDAIYDHWAQTIN